jgi:hypothetical protein
MKKIFYAGLLLIIFFELLNVYFIMPMPGSQEIKSLDAAYFIHLHRLIFRVIIVLLIISGSYSAFTVRLKWVPLACVVVTLGIVYLLNFKMAADKMFRQPRQLISKTRIGNKVGGNYLVIGVERNGEAKAYPIRFLAYHHQVQDSIAGKPIIVTYCSVCRTGRVYEPIVKGRIEKFRLVGMDHFNAMFEDATTKSWWRQETGGAVAGPLKGQYLPELMSVQMTLDKWFELYPGGTVMQPEESSKERYDSLEAFEKGKSKSRLLHTDTLSWKDKSWVIGLEDEGQNKVYDWNELKKENIINGMVGQIPVVIALSSDRQSFAAFERPSVQLFTIRNDTLISNGRFYSFSGNDIEIPSLHLKKVKAYQQYWHSWRTFYADSTMNKR